MKFLDNLKDNILASYLHYDQEYRTSEGLTITLRCPMCKEYTDVDAPDDKPPTGNTKGEGFCHWCGKRFVYYY